MNIINVLYGPLYQSVTNSVLSSDVEEKSDIGFRLVKFYIVEPGTSVSQDVNLGSEISYVTV